MKCDRNEDIDGLDLHDRLFITNFCKEGGDTFFFMLFNSLPPYRVFGSRNIFWYTILNNEISKHSIECYIYKFAYGRSIIMGFPIVMLFRKILLLLF